MYKLYVASQLQSIFLSLRISHYTPIFLLRRAIARVIGQIETILKRAVIPGDQSVLESGGYLTQSPTPFRLTPIELDELIQKNVDVSPHLKFRIRHPLSSLVSNLLVPILKFTRTYQLLWTKQVSRDFNGNFDPNLIYVPNDY